MPGPHTSYPPDPEEEATRTVLEQAEALRRDKSPVKVRKILI